MSVPRSTGLQIMTLLLQIFSSVVHFPGIPRRRNTLYLSSPRLCFFIVLNEPRCAKTGFRGFRPGPSQTGLYSHRRWLEA